MQSWRVRRRSGEVLVDGMRLPAGIREDGRVEPFGELPVQGHEEDGRALHARAKREDAEAGRRGGSNSALLTGHGDSDRHTPTLPLAPGWNRGTRVPDGRDTSHPPTLPPPGDEAAQSVAQFYPKRDELRVLLFDRLQVLCDHRIDVEDAEDDRATPLVVRRVDGRELSHIVRAGNDLLGQLTEFVFDGSLTHATTLPTLASAYMRATAIGQGCGHD